MNEILKMPCGVYATNCYIIKGKNADIVIDPGFNSINFIKNNCSKVVAVLNTHGHHDHVWDNKIVSQEFNAPLYCHRDDIFMLADPNSCGFIHSDDIAIGVGDGESLVFDDLKFTFHHFAGHTPGCSIIEFDNFYFSGDFLFERSIGRWDFLFSSAEDMIKSLEKAKNLKDDFILLPGHGNQTKVSLEKPNFDLWIRYVKNSI
ncbi:MBL fold metallo-hydrolase [Campylobacter sp. MG1]|uniref:MBL fold metallo-hydrolase n=1 Tax=Campylobacter sp. MG1 TaxID=2976332 RepID=UPI00226CBDA3|nr:MBL fold metallo-hydrolase [Campylobacter sp. MG1]